MLRPVHQRKMPLIARATLAIGLLIVAASALAMFSVDSMQRSDLRKEMMKRGDVEIRQFAMATAAAILVEDAAVLSEIAREMVDSDPDIDHVQVKNEEGFVLANAGDPAGVAGVERVIREEGIEVAGENFGSVRITWNLARRLSAIRVVSRQTGAVISLLLLITGAVALWILHRIAIHPIRLIEGRLRALDPSGEIPPLQVRAPEEIQRLNAAIDRLADEQRRRQKLELQLRQGQKMEAVGRLAGGVAHNFNNSLTVVLGHVDLLRDHRPDDRELQGPLDAIEQSARHAAALTTQLLAVGRRQPQRPLSVPVDQLLRDIAERLMPIVGDRVHLKVASAPGVGCILVDPGLFESVILNLVVNARDALPEGGTIELYSEIAGDADCRRVNANDDHGAVRITVKDDGVGIEAEMLDKLFDPFFTTKREGEGTGLGLSTVYGVIDQSGGHVEAASATKGGGASFTIVLPCVPSGQTESAPAIVREPRTTLSGEHALLVEDDEAVRRLLVTRLETLGLEIAAVRGMEDAFRAFSDIPRKFDLLITDVGLPDGSGVELAVWARTLFPRLPVLFVTGGAGLEAGLSDMPLTTTLRKPFTSAEVEEALLSLLDASAGESMPDAQAGNVGERAPDSP